MELGSSDRLDGVAVNQSAISQLVPYTAYESVRQDDVKNRRWFAIGDPVHLNVRGEGFVVASEGVALSPGDEGRCARVRMDNGRVLCGQPVGERTVEVSL